MNKNNDEIRFNKLYELLGDEVNNIFVDKDTKDIFTNNKEENIVNNNITNNTDKDIVNNNQILINASVLPQNILNNNNQETINVDTNKENNVDDNNNKDNVNNQIIEITPVNIDNDISNDNINNAIGNNYTKNSIFRNKNIISKNEFDDGIDGYDNNKKSIVDILNNKKFLLVVFILVFIFVCIVVFKAFYFGNKVDEYENYFVEIEKKEEEIAKVYEGHEIDNDVLKKVAATELISCINAKVDIDNLPDSINSIINEINNYYNQSNNYFSFTYKDIYTGFTVSYNENQNIFTASTIKAPTDIYIYEMASLGNVDLDQELTYTGGYYNTGTGVLKNKPINTKYSVRTLLEYSTVYSDNAAHNMLMDKFGRENMLEFWQKKGTNAIFTANNNWGVTNAHDATIYMDELYRFYVDNNDYGNALMNNFMNAKPKFISGKNNYIVANKSGWSGTAIHDVSIVFADNPYIVVGLSNLGETDYYMSYFYKVNDLAYRLHTEYWKYKMSTCNSIKQY